MMRKILSMFLVLCMIVTMVPGTAVAEETPTVVTETDLNTDIANVTEGGTIVLGSDITLTSTVTIASGNNKSFTLDLNGHTLNGGNKTAIKHEGTGTLSIIDTQDNGTVTAAGSDSNHTIYNAGTGFVSIEDITVSASGTETCAIYNASSGTVNVFSGTVSADLTAIWNDGTGVVNVHDGIVSASGTSGEAIWQTGASTVNISGGIISAENGIGINNTGTTSTTKILGGTPIIKGGNKAMNTAPELGAGVQARASFNYSGLPLESYIAINIDLYKYLKFEPSAAVAQIGGIGYPTLQATVNAVEGGQIIQLLNDINLTEPVTIPSTNASSFTLDLNGKTISNSTVLTTIQHEGSGTLTIQDSSGGGSIKNTVANGYASTIKITNDGSVTLLSGTIEAFVGAIDNSGSGDVTVSGGKVKSDGPGIMINSTGSGKVIVSGGTVESTNASSTAIARAYGSSGKIIISGTANIVATYRCIFLHGNESSEPVLEITGGTLTHTGTTGYVIDVLSNNTILVSGGTLESTEKTIIGHNTAYGGTLATVKINIPAAGSAIFKGGEKVLAEGYALTLENAGVSAASGNFNGTNPVSAYNPDAIGTYKYLAFGPATKVNDLDLRGKLTAPVKNETPITDIDTAQYTGTVAWPGSPVKFLGSTIYTANVTLTAKPGYTFSGLAENSFSFAGASVTHAAGSGNTLSVTVIFANTAAKVLASIAVTTPPTKTVYKYEENFSSAGMVVKATYDDGTADANYTDYTVDKIGPLEMSDTTITLTANVTSITTIQAITVTKADGPAVPSVDFSFDGANPGKLMGTTASMEYSLDGGSNWTDCTADMDLTTRLGSITAANDIQVRIKETDTHQAGAIQTIDITQPLLPTGIGKTDETSSLNNGTITGVSSLMEYKKSGDANYTAISGSMVMGLTPGEYLVRLKATGTALASLDATVNIAAFTKKTPTAADLIYNLTAVNFDGTAKPVSVTADSGKTLGAITVIYNGITTAPPINAGTYAVTVNIAGSDDYNAVTGLSLGNYTINKVAYTGPVTVSASVLVSGQTGATVTLPDLPLGASYGTPTTGGTMTMTAMSIAGTTLTYTAPASTVGETGTMTIPVTGATNYNDYSIVVTVTSTAKAPQVISYATATIAKTYGDVPFTNSLSRTTVNGTITYESDDTSVATVNPTTGAVVIMAVGDGSATITATAAETGTHAQATASYTLTVTPKALTLKADDKSMTKGDGLPVFTYTATGLVDGDAVTTAPTMSTTANGNAVGSFDIIISDGVVANAASYNITYTKGILTVAERLFTVTVINGTGSGSYAEGATVTITANGRSGYTFTGWNGADVTFADAAQKTTTFTMPAKAVTVTANYRQNSSGGGGGSAPAPTPAADTFTFTPSQITEMLSNNQAIKIENGLQILAKPEDIPRAAEDTVVIKASEIKSTESLNTFYLAYPDQQGLRKGYTVTFSSEKNGQSTPITQLNGNITLIFQLTEEDLRSMDPSTLVVYKEGDDGSVTTLTGTYDWEKNTLSVTTAHLCNFYLMAWEGIPAQRLSGTNRYETAAAISRQGWQTAENIILASGENFPDALVAASLAGLKDAPVLLTAKDSLSPETLLEIQRLQAKTIYILGGPGVIAQAVEDRLAQHYATQRISGADRYETAVKLGALIQAAQSIAPTENEGKTVILATGLNYPDSLSIAPFAAQYNLPILFTGRDTLHEKTAQALKDWGVQKVILLGGTGVISEAVATILKNDLKMGVTRLSGSDRYLTSLAIAKYFEVYEAVSPDNTGAGDSSKLFTMAALATGDGYADALAGAALAGKEKMPLFLVNKSSLNTELNAYLKELQLQKIYVYGGEAVLPDRVKKELSLKQSGN